MLKMADHFISKMMGNYSYLIYKNIYCLWIFSVIWIKYTGLIFSKSDENGLGVYIFFKYIGWYLGVIGKLHNNECLIYVFTGECFNGTPNIFTN